MSLKKPKSHQEIYEISGAFHQVKIGRIIDPEVIQQGQILITADILIGTGNLGPKLEGRV